MQSQRAGEGRTPTVVEWESLDAEGPNLLLDTAAIQKKYDARQRTNQRVKEAVFTAPRGLSKEVFERGTRQNINTWLTALLKQGWQLISRVEVGPPGVAREEHGIVILDRQEFRVRGVFKLVGPYVKQRIEFPLDTVKQDPAHKVTPTSPHRELSKLIRAG